MQLKLLSAFLVTAITLTGCGGGNSDDKYTTSPTNPVEQNTLGWQKSTTNTTSSLDLVDDITGTIGFYTMSFPFIDALVLNAHDIVVDDVVCENGGSYSYRNRVIQLTNCDGLFYNYTLNGRIDVSMNDDEFSFKNLELNHNNINETVLVNGNIRVGLSTDTAIITTNQLVMNIRYLIDQAAYAVVEHTVSGYSSTWKSLNHRDTSIATKGNLQSKGNPEGDYHVSFDSTKAPFIYNVESEDNYPYTGSLSIQDRSNSRNLITLTANSDAKSFLYKVVENNRVLINRDSLW